MKIKVRRFSPEDDRLLKADWASHVPVEDIAKKLRRSTAVVRQRVHYLGLRRSHSVTRVMRWAPPHIVARRKRIGDRAFITEAHAWRKAEALRPELERLDEVARLSKVISKSSLSRDEKMLAKRKIGATLQEIAEEFSITRQRVMQIVQDMVMTSAVKQLEKSYRQMPKVAKAEFLQRIGTAAT